MAEPCGNCDTCISGSATAHLIDLRDDAASMTDGPGPYVLNAQVSHREWGHGVVMRHESDRITVLFEQVGYRTLALAALQADDGLLVVQQTA